MLSHPHPDRRQKTDRRNASKAEAQQATTLDKVIVLKIRTDIAHPMIGVTAKSSTAFMPCMFPSASMVHVHVAGNPKARSNRQECDDDKATTYRRFKRLTLGGDPAVTL